MERNLVDAMGVARNICIDPRLVPGGGACEMAVSRGLSDQASSLQVCGSGTKHNSTTSSFPGGKLNIFLGVKINSTKSGEH